MAYLMIFPLNPVPPTSNVLGVDSDAVPITARAEALGGSGHEGADARGDEWRCHHYVVC